MIVDAVDAHGRRYMRAATTIGEPCVECGQPTGPTYYMRNDADDGTQDNPLEALLYAMTYDSVCCGCAEIQLKADAT